MSNESLAKISQEYRLDLDRFYPCPIARVWKAISVAEEISAWMKYPTELECRIGGRIHIDFKEDGSLEGLIFELEPEKVLAYTWGNSVLRWTIEAKDAGTQLHFSNSSVTPEIVLGFAAGWHAFIDHLGPHLAGKKIKDRYDEIIPVYQEHYKDIQKA